MSEVAIQESYQPSLVPGKIYQHTSPYYTLLSSSPWDFELENQNGALKSGHYFLVLKVLHPPYRDVAVLVSVIGEPDLKEGWFVYDPNLEETVLPSRWKELEHQHRGTQEDY